MGETPWDLGRVWPKNWPTEASNACLLDTPKIMMETAVKCGVPKATACAQPEMLFGHTECTAPFLG